MWHKSRPTNLGNQFEQVARSLQRLWSRSTPGARDISSFDLRHNSGSIDVRFTDDSNHPCSLRSVPASPRSDL